MHQSVLATGGRTIAVLARGTDPAYPAGHADPFPRIEQPGLHISEVAPGGAPARQRLIDRGRIMAALSSTTVIVKVGRGQETCVSPTKQWGLIAQSARYLARDE